MSKSINSSICSKTRSVWGAMTAALAVLALMMFTVGCGDKSPTGPDNPPGCTPGVDCPGDGLDPNTDWQDAVKEYDQRLVTLVGSHVSDSDDSAWVDVNRNVGKWQFGYYEANGIVHHARAMKSYLSGQNRYGEYTWHTHDGKLYLEPREDSDYVRSIYKYAISASGVLTLTDAGGTTVSFNKVKQNELIDIPPTAQHDARLITNTGDYDDDESWARAVKGVELVIWNFYLDDNSMYRSAYTTRIGADNVITETNYHDWYTLGDKLHLVNALGSETVYTYAFTNNDATLTLTAGGSSVVLTKMTNDEFFAAMKPDLPSGAGHDPALHGDEEDDLYWRNDEFYIGFEENGVCMFEDSDDNFGIYWWYTQNGTLRLLNFVTGTALRTFTAYNIDGTKLTLTEGGQTIVLWAWGEEDDGSRERDPALILGEDYVWWRVEHSNGDGFGYQFLVNGRVRRHSYTEYNGGYDSYILGSWYTEGNNLYAEGISSSYMSDAMEYAISQNGNTLTLNMWGSTYTFTKTHIDNIGPTEPVVIGRDQRLLLDDDHAWVNFTPGVSFAQFNLQYEAGEYWESQYASLSIIDANDNMTGMGYDIWYTNSANNTLYLGTIDYDYYGTTTDTVITTTFTYSFSNGNNTLAISGSGINMTFTKTRPEDIMSILIPEPPTGAGRDPLLHGNEDGYKGWQGGDEIYFYFTLAGIGGGYQNDVESPYTWYTLNDSLYIVAIVAQTVKNTYHYSIDENLLTLTNASGTISLVGSSGGSEDGTPMSAPSLSKSSAAKSHPLRLTPPRPAKRQIKAVAPRAQSSASGLAKTTAKTASTRIAPASAPKSAVERERKKMRNVFDRRDRR